MDGGLLLFERFKFIYFKRVSFWWWRLGVGFWGSVVSVYCSVVVYSS